ncbi:MAG: DUF4132 domain-containing protein, partial [Maricaulaceae bacterium]
EKQLSAGKDTKPTSKTPAPPPAVPKTTAEPVVDHMALVKAFEAFYARRSEFYYTANAKKIKEEPAYQAIVKMKPKARADFMVFFAKNPPLLRKGAKLTFLKARDTLDWQARNFVTDLCSGLMRRKADFTPSQIAEILTSLRIHAGYNFASWPIGWVINQLEKSLKVHELSKEDVEALKALANTEEFKADSYYGSDIQKARLKLLELVAGDDPTLATYPLDGRVVGDVIKADIDKMPKGDAVKWYQLFQTVAKATGGKPTKKFQDETKVRIDAIGAADFKSHVRDWFTEAAKPMGFRVDENDTSDHYGAGQLNAELQNLLKGLAWAMARFHDEKSLGAVARLAEKSFERLPGIGPAAAGLGNACIHTLATSKGLSGVSHLSRLKLRVKQNNTQKLIQKHIETQAEKLGLKPAQIEEMAAPDFGLEMGVKEATFKDYTLRLEATRVGQAVLSWLKTDGTTQKSVPSFIKDSAPMKRQLADMRAQAKEIKKASSAQRDRIDRLFTEDMRWEVEDFEKYYLNHGLVGPMARALIWTLTIKGEEKPALFHDGKWQDSSGKVIVGTPESFQLWHPIMSEAKEVLAWRERLMDLKIKQPFKQSYREVYLLTDAEVNTKVYSNRMAAHIIKQHQFNSLSAIRGWKYSLLGAYDDGRDGEIAQKRLPAYDMSAEFWIDEILDDADSFNDSGIWDYVATDQVRFTRGDTTLDLVDIPPIILSEILRDADLFVGVASIGNDPTWMDRGGAARVQTYWQSYSFGDLTETAKTRKAVLESLVPRLKIRDIAHIDGKFLVVKGTRHSYKIHIGSGNILIMPNDQYLCIVPGRGKDKNVDGLYLPFEGDRGLSIVLSKAFMLAEDHKITDSTILSQL